MRPRRLSIGETVATLRADLVQLRDDSDPEPRPAATLIAVAHVVAVEDLVPGMNAIISTADGFRFVEVIQVHVDELVVKPWGCAPCTVRRSVIASARIVGPHTWHERQQVARSQRAGRPA